MKRVLFIVIMLWLALLVYYKVSYAACESGWQPCIPMNAFPTSTTFNCADWTNYSQPLNCWYLTKQGGTPCSITSDDPYSLDGPYEEIKAAANYPGGGGGSGLRHYLGIINYPGAPANGSGGTAVFFDSPGPQEFYMRFYIRFQSGWIWGGLRTFKTLYYGSFNGPSPIFNFPDGQGVLVSDTQTQANLHVGMGLYPQGGDNQWHGCTACGWVDMYPTGTSDGSWHQVETHLKMNSPSQSNGIFEVWIDGVKKVSDLAVNYGNTGQITGWSHVKIGDNGNVWQDFNVLGCHYIDYDDIVVSTTGPIGLINSPPFPSPPTNLQVK